MLPYALIAQAAQTASKSARQTNQDTEDMGSNMISLDQQEKELNKESAQSGVQNAGSVLNSIQNLYNNRANQMARNRGLMAYGG